MELAIDESSFTGETEPVLKSTDMEPKKVSSRISERRNVAFMGTLVRCGRGKVRVSLFPNCMVITFTEFCIVILILVTLTFSQGHSSSGP